MFSRKKMVGCETFNIYHVWRFTYAQLAIGYYSCVRKVAFLSILSILFVACAPSVEIVQSPTQPATPEAKETPIKRTTSTVVVPSSTPAEESTVSPRLNNRIDDPNEYVFSQLLPWDGIRPVYNPQFATADEVNLTDDELIIGISIDNEAKAYPISVLRFREMVNDELAGIPILVTW
jgi:hypothetical protein